MTESKVFRLTEDLDASRVGNEVENFLRNNKNLMTEGTKTPDGYFIQAKEPEGSSWKMIAGMTMAIQVQIIEISDSITVNIGNGRWSDKIGAGVAVAVLFAPLAVTAAIGAINQKRLPNQIFEHIEKYILGNGNTVMMNSFENNVTSDNEILCSNCNSANSKNTKFCSNCGSSLFKTCPNCGSSVDYDTKFCTECGSPMKEPEKICPECGSKVVPDMKFCGECGTKIE